jgi:hypothetical protein
MDLNDSLLTEVGRITVLFGRLEASLKMQIAKRVAHDDISIGNILTTGIDFRRLTDIFHSLLLYTASKELPRCGKTTDKELEERLRAVKAFLDKARDARNNVVHSLWLVRIEVNVGSGDSTVRFVSDVGVSQKDKHKQKGMVTEQKDYSVPDLQSVITQIIEAQRMLDDFMLWLAETIG